MLSFSEVVDLSILGLELGRKFPDAECRLIEAMGDAANKLKNHPKYGTDRDLEFMYKELVSRIRQQMQTSPGADQNLYIDSVKNVLANLGDPEVA